MFWSIITTLNTQKITLLLHSFNNGFKTYERNTIYILTMYSVNIQGFIFVKDKYQS